MTENHFGPSAVNVITKACSGEIRTVSQAQETKVHKARSDFAVLVSQPLSGEETKVFELLGMLDLGGSRDCGCLLQSLNWGENVLPQVLNTID